MKTIRMMVVALVLLVTIMIAFVVIQYYKSSLASNPNIENTKVTITQNNIGESSTTTPTSLISDTAGNLMKDIDNRVTWIKDRIDKQWYIDHYDSDKLIYRYFDQDFELESFTSYHFYYNEDGKLIYAEIIHYRDANYSIYFYNNELLHVKVGPFSYAEGPFINGNISDVQTVITEAPRYAFVLNDLAFCLSHAYL